MFTCIEIECIGNSRLGDRPRGVWRIGGWSHNGLIEDRLTPHRDYSRANSVGSRGIYEYYFLIPGNIYHVIAPESWKRSDEYYCKIEGDNIIRAENFNEAMRWLKSISGFRS